MNGIMGNIVIIVACSLVPSVRDIWNTNQVYTNKESSCELRINSLNNEKARRTKMRSVRCCDQRDMIVEDGLTDVSGWLIVECVECGKRHDIWAY